MLHGEDTNWDLIDQAHYQTKYKYPSAIDASNLFLQIIDLYTTKYEPKMQAEKTRAVAHYP
jgi:hypothetical protein